MKHQKLIMQNERKLKIIVNDKKYFANKL